MWRRVIGRFGFAYWILFCSEILTQIFDFNFLYKTVDPFWRHIGLFTGRIIGVEHVPIEPSGSGDKTIDYLVLLAIAALSIFITGIWTGLDREGRHDERVRGFVRIVLRYSLALLMLSYGIAKLDSAHCQFPPPGGRVLQERFGDASPMGMLWTFMGTSQTYTKFAGLGEILGGTLLLSRRTTLAGALLLVPVLTNVVMLNFCYDVPVKINSTHYLVMALVLALPDVRRILDVVIFRRAVEAPAPIEPLRLRGRRWPVLIAKLVIIGAFVVPTAKAYWEAYAPHPTMWFDGYWEVDSFTRNGVLVPSVRDDKTRWNRMKFETDAEHSYMRWHNMDKSTSTLYILTEQTPDHLTFKDGEGTGPNVTFALTRPDATHFTLTGKVENDELKVTLYRFDAAATPLMSRGFHWISEQPYNR